MMNNTLTKQSKIKIWDCLKCEFSTDSFDDVWEHCKGLSHVMQMRKGQ